MTMVKKALLTTHSSAVNVTGVDKLSHKSKMEIL